MADLNVGIAFAAGLASFISPCCLPDLPVLSVAKFPPDRFPTGTT